MSDLNELTMSAGHLLTKLAGDSAPPPYNKERVEKEYNDIQSQRAFNDDADAWNAAHPEQAAEAKAQQEEFFGGGDEKSLLAALVNKLQGAYSSAEPYIPSVATGVGGAGLIHELLSKEKDKGIMDYLPWLLLGGAGGYGMYNQFSGK